MEWLVVIIAALSFVWGVISSQKKHKKELRKETNDLISTKMDEKSFTQYVVNHNYDHNRIKEDIDKKASNEKMDMALEMIRMQSEQNDRIEKMVTELLKR